MTINKYMALAIDEAKKTKFDIPVGAIIVQNDKIIGAVSHVEDSDPTYGYGLFITYMV